MTMPSLGIKDLLVNTSQGVYGAPNAAQLAAGAWGIYIGKQPDDSISPDRAITIYDSGGKTPEHAWLIDYPSIQVRVRGEQNKYQEAYDKAVAVRTALHALPPQQVNGDRWDSVSQRGDVAFLGYDKNRRPEFTVNFDLIIEPSSVVGSNRLPL